MRSPLHLSALALCAAPAVAQNVESANQAETSVPANTLILIADDLGVDMVGAYAESSVAPYTPNIDRIAVSGMLFRNAWTAPMCSPSRATIQTGRQPHQTGIGFVLTDDAEGIDTDETTLPEMLAQHPDHDFTSGLFGKWHLGGGNTGPADNGYDVYKGYPNNLYAPQSYFDFTRFDNGVPVQVTTYATTDTVDQALAWIATAPEPWLCVVSFHAPHEPFHVPPSDLHKVDVSHGHPRFNPRPLYEAAVQAMDTEIGRLMDTLGGQLDRTNVFFMGDNGTPRRASVAPFLPEHAKLTPYEGGINVPFIVRGPAVAQVGSETVGLINLADLYATVADLSGVDLSTVTDAEHPLDSISLRPYLEHPDHASMRQMVLAEAFKPGILPGVNDFSWFMLRDGRYKFILIDDGGYTLEMYDLESDPFESCNLVGCGLNAEQSAALSNALLELRELLLN